MCFRGICYHPFFVEVLYTSPEVARWFDRSAMVMQTLQNDSVLQSDRRVLKNVPSQNNDNK